MPVARERTARTMNRCTEAHRKLISILYIRITHDLADIFEYVLNCECVPNENVVMDRVREMISDYVVEAAEAMARETGRADDNDDGISCTGSRAGE